LTDWKNKISNHAQLGGIETAVLDNGAGRGMRIAWINTGTGLRYKLTLDRAMDITDAFYHQHSLAWLGDPAMVQPQLFPDRGLNWLRTFGGGLITTCGLSHVGGPETDEYGERGLHGLVSNIPAEIESIMQPDPANDNMEMSITGRIQQSQIFGPRLELKRTISGTLGKASIRIHDEVVNRGNEPAPHMLIYHCNFGWPLVDEGTDIIWKGAWRPRYENPDNRIFNKNNNFRKCPAPMEEHRGSGEEVVFVDIEADPSGLCAVGLYNAGLGLAVALKFNKKQLPWFTNWQHWGAGEYVTGLEPGTNPPIGQAKARAQKELIFIGPGEKKIYDLEFEVLTDKKTIQDFVKLNGPS
jgi:Domain of unknown function (DUF4432)